MFPKKFNSRFSGGKPSPNLGGSSTKYAKKSGISLSTKKGS
jgi:hypothetical protein